MHSYEETSYFQYCCCLVLKLFDGVQCVFSADERLAAVSKNVENGDTAFVDPSIHSAY
jgi:hypothetical protein